MGIRDTMTDFAIGLNQGPFLIVGLGNIGEDYKLTRHNAGFLALEQFSNKLDLGKFKEKTDLNSLLIETNIGGEKVILAKPTTFMNKSGLAVIKLQNYFGVNDPRLLVVYDDVDVDFGTIKSRLSGGNAGHKGIKSIEQLAGDQFARVRIGTRNEHLSDTETADFVLAKFSHAEQQELAPILDYSIQMIEAFIDNKFSETSHSL